jgi:hypothetical protein
MINEKNHICIQCNKEYTSRQSLWKHNKKFHNYSDGSITVKKFKCEYCDKLYNSKQLKIVHLQTCKKNLINNNIIMDKKFEELKNTIIEMKKKNINPNTKIIKNINYDIDDNNTSNNIINKTNDDSIDNTIIKTNDDSIDNTIIKDTNKDSIDNTKDTNNDSIHNTINKDTNKDSIDNTKDTNKFNIKKYKSRYCINEVVYKCEMSKYPDKYISKIDAKLLY